MEKKTASITLDNIKDSSGWHEMITELFTKKFETEFPDETEDDICERIYKKTTSTFEYGEFASLTIEVDEDLNIVGGKIIPFKKQ